MLRRVLSFGLPALGLGFVCVGVACGEGGDVPRVAVAANFVMPKGVLDRVSTLTLTVREGSVACDPAVGETSFPDGPGAATEIARRDLGTTDCAAGARFCGELSLPKSDVSRVFSAEAKGEGLATLAVGCASATVNQDALPIAIKMFRFLAPATCGDRILHPPAQC